MIAMNNSWKQIVNCAISCCLDYKQKPVVIAFDNEQYLKRSIEEYVKEKTNCDTKSAAQLYEQFLRYSEKRGHPEEQISIWVVIGMAIVIVVGIINLLLALSNDWYWLFLMYFSISVAVVIVCIKYIVYKKNIKKAAEIWRENMTSDSVESLLYALHKMENLLL